MSEFVSATASLLSSHSIESAFNRGWVDEPDWKIVCSCSWETWEHVTKEGAAEEYVAHVLVDIEDSLFRAAMEAMPE